MSAPLPCQRATSLHCFLRELRTCLALIIDAYMIAILYNALQYSFSAYLGSLLAGTILAVPVLVITAPSRLTPDDRPFPLELSLMIKLMLAAPFTAAAWESFGRADNIPAYVWAGAVAFAAAVLLVSAIKDVARGTHA